MHADTIICSGMQNYLYCNVHVSLAYSISNAQYRRKLLISFQRCSGSNSALLLDQISYQPLGIQEATMIRYESVSKKMWKVSLVWI